MKTSRSTWQYVAAIIWMVFTVALASWWLIFGLSQARHLAALEGPDGAQIGRVTRMLVLEGVILVGMLVAGGGALLIAIRLEQRRRRDLRAFFMAFTHDLKTSLTSLRLQAEALREDVPQAAGNPNLQRMLQDSVRLQLQLENALALATSDGAVLIESLDIPALVDYLRDDFPELRIHVTGDGRVRADRRALESVLRNVLQNAVVHGHATRVSLDLRRRSSGMEIVVADDGTGATVDLSDALERPFQRPSATSGSGVGLYVCGRLLHQMHGRIRVRAGSPGFTVSIELPEAV
jgi:signal transduction histidine kinase